MFYKRQNSMENEINEEVATEAETLENDTQESDNSENELELLRKKVKTLEAQKNHFKNKLEKVKEPINLQTNTQSGLSKEEVILYARGYSDDEVDLAIKISKIDNIPLLKALDSDIFKTKMEAKKKKELSEKAEINSVSSSFSYNNKDVRKLTPEEHKEAYYKELAKNGIL